MATPSMDWTELGEHSRGVGRLAASLLSDFHGGEDLAQEAVLRALVAEPGSRHLRSGAAWLKVTVRRLAVNEWRARARRARREKAVARPEAIPSSEEVLERAELSRKVLDALDGLSEPYGTTLRDHFVGGLGVEALAERDGLSTHTVRSRIQRGKAALRASLETAEDFRGEGWSVALAPLALPLFARASVSRAGASLSLFEGLTATIGGWVLMKKLALVVVCLVVGFLALGTMMPTDSPTDSPTEGRAEVAVADSGESEPVGAGLDPLSKDLGSSRRAAEVSEGSPEGAALGTRVTGLVLDSDQRPVEGVRVSWEGYAVVDREISLLRSAGATTDVEGRYSVLLPYEPDSIWSAEFRGDRFQTNAFLKSNSGDRADLPELVPGEVEAPTVTLGPAGAARGRVVDEAGEPLANAWVRIGPDKSESRYGLVPMTDTHSDSEGRFVLGHVAPGALGIAVSRVGRATAYLPEREFEQGVTLDLGDICLETSEHISGVIVDEAGEPIVGQGIRASSQEKYNVSTRATTDASGRFDLVLRSNTTQRLRVEREGYASIGAFGFESLTVEPGVTDLRIQLDPLPAWTFRVVDSLGAPIERFRLSLVHGGGSKSVQRVHSSGGARSQPLHPGGVEFRHARAGLDLVRVRSEGFLPIECDVEGDPDSPHTQTLELSRGAILSGRVLRGDVPAEGVEVSVLGSRRFGSRTELSARTDEEGRYALRGLGHGRVSITARSADGRLTASTTQPIDKDLFVDPGLAPGVVVEDLVLLGSGSIEGSITMPAGVAPDGLEVFVGYWGEAKRFPVRSDGTFRIPDVETGSHELRVTSRPGRIDDVPPVSVVVREDEVTHALVDASAYGLSRLDLTIEVQGYAPEDLNVRVLHGLLNPEVRPSSRTGAIPEVDSDGKVTLWPRASGIAHLELMLPDAPSMTLSEPAFTLTPGSVESHHVTVELGRLEVELPPGFEFSDSHSTLLRLRQPGIPHPLTGWGIASEDSDSARWTRTRDGVCLVEPVPAGSFELHFESRDKWGAVVETCSVPVTVVGGETRRVALPATR